MHKKRDTTTKICKRPLEADALRKMPIARKLLKREISNKANQLLKKHNSAERFLNLRLKVANAGGLSRAFIPSLGAAFLLRRNEQAESGAFWQKKQQGD
jgi:hypothetical protein